MAYKESIPMSVFMEGAEQGDAESQYQVGMHYYCGDPQVEPDYIQAILWLARAAEQDHADALYQLADICQMAQRRREAENWRRRAAKNGDPNVQQEIAEDLESQGKYEEALVWYEKAAESGSYEAVYDVQRLKNFIERRKSHD